MKEYMTTSGAYERVLRDVLEAGSPCAPRGEPCLEIEDYAFRVLRPDAAPITTASEERNARIARYTAQEFDLFERQERRAGEFAKHAMMWGRIANPDGTVNSAYGWLIWGNPSCGKSKHAQHGPLTPWEWAKLSLMRDKDTRQAVLRFSLPAHQWFGNKDQVCTMHGYFRIRGEALHLTVVMRSNDAVKGLVYDMPWFCHLIGRMRDELAEHYPDLEAGTYTHIAHSMHIYERDRAAVMAMLHGDENHAAA